ncbi:HD family hydrolase [Parafrankia sp. EUN1f]|uniref:HD domain-containing protein n=1 Tax=Parafrankia sp. EUN1f TaxID=102897 RepID=UPI0001C45FB9|nr:HD domain-containing protein [Parafrankia sp. EUN1f]EFC81381.1 metal dependent phosphohydrolase [Parafrankia sp. EUN1f]
MSTQFPTPQDSMSPAGPGEPVIALPSTSDSRLARQLGFILEIDKLKSVLRRSRLADDSRAENDAEHSWHLAMMAVVLGEYADEEVDTGRVLRMLLVHDLVEIYAGDTFVYDQAAIAEQEAREKAAADRLFPLLPRDQAVQLRSLWEEFEARRTPDARFARALDRLQPLILNYVTGGGSWQTHGVRAQDVLAHQRVVSEGSLALWEYINQLVGDAVRRGYLAA